MNFIKNPNLPGKRVKAVLLSIFADQGVIRSLNKAGIEVVTVLPCGDLAPPTASHPDMLFHHLGDNRMLFYRGVNISVCKSLEKLGLELIESKNLFSPHYPFDIALNAARIGNKLFCNEQYTDEVILNYCKKNEVHIIPVKQGYTKCSIVIVDENSIITADKNISQAAEKCGLCVLKIREGFINLPGYNFGFIGGCCGKIAEDIIAFCGKISNHPDYAEIKHFINSRGIKVQELGTEILSDIGGVIPLLE